MNRADALLSKLKDSLPKPHEGQKHQPQRVGPRRAQGLRASSAQRVTETFAEDNEIPPPPTATRNARVPLCFSVYETDVQRLDAIRDFMRGKGYRNISNSEALRLACRAVEVDDRFVEVYEQMRKEDGRRK